MEESSERPGSSYLVPGMILTTCFPLLVLLIVFHSCVTNGSFSDAAAANVRFSKPSASQTTGNYSEAERQMNELRWTKEKTLEDIKRAQVLRDHALYNFGKKKEEFVRCLSQSSYTNEVV